MVLKTNSSINRDW